MAENLTDTLLASAARTATVQSATQTNRDCRGVHIYIKTTAASLTPSVVPTVEGYDETSQSWYVLLTGAAITGVGAVTLKVYPGITTSTNVAVSDVLPRKWRLNMTHADTDSITYSAGANLIV